MRCAGLAIQFIRLASVLTLGLSRAYGESDVRISPLEPGLASCGSRGSVGYAPCSAVGSTVFQCDFESGLGGCGGWSIDQGVWQLGQPTPQPAAHSGFWCAATVLNGNYPNGANTRLSSASIALPPLSGCESLQLRFWHWYRIWLDDTASIEIRTLRPTGWGPWLAVRGASATYGSFSPIWTQASLDLSSYADSTVRVGFRFQSGRCGTCGPTEDLGWYIDDVSVVRMSAPPAGPVVESFENGWGGWSVTQGQWEIGAATSGPNSGHSGPACAGTVLSGNYFNALDSRLISPPYQLPAIEACESLQLRFWHWFRVWADDVGTVEISTLRPSGWGPFLPLRGTNASVDTGQDGYSGWNPSWSRPVLDISTYADSTVRVAFRFATSQCGTCGPTVDAGWYIDDLEIVRTPPWTALEFPNYETFSGGQGGWSVEGGQWEIGRPSPQVRAHSDSLCAGTILGGNYYNNLVSRLISPSIHLGAAVADLRLCFWHWYLIEGDDVARVQVSTLQNGVWGAWQDLNSQTFVGDSAGWTPYCSEDLASFANSTIRLAFYFATARCGTCGPTENLGWYIDDIQIRGVLPSDVAPEVHRQRISLQQNVPNPFNPSTTIQYTVERFGSASLEILDVAGRHIRTLFAGEVTPGAHVARWDGRDSAGRPSASGVYVCRLTGGDQAVSRRVVLVR